MAALHTGQWIKFFEQAGIPDKAAATYALTFAENRIQMNMLLDLNKEYLRDMGITLMGDVIAILRHARTKHEEIARERLLVTSGKEKAVSSKAVEVPVNILKPAAPIKNPYTATRIRENFSREQDVPVSDPKPKPKVPSREPSISTESSHLRKVSAPQQEVAVPVKRKVKSTLRPEETIVIRDDPPTKKVRRVSPEEEGGYKIKMPSGSTPRSQQILAKSKELARKNVFQRLGSGTTASGTRSPPSTPAVSSTTGANAAFTVINLSSGPNQKIVKPVDSKGFSARSQSGSSVFQRLGDKQVSSSTQSVAKRDKSLPYSGILRTPDKRVTRIVKQKSAEPVTMVADSLDNIRTEVRERLGSVLKTSSSEFSQKVEQKKSVPDSSKVGVKARLGISTHDSAKSERQSSVKDRLKVPSTKIDSRVPTPYSSVQGSSEGKRLKSRGVFSRLGGL